MDFLFLGHGTAPVRTPHLWMVLADPAGTAASLENVLREMGPVRSVRHEGAVLELRLKSSTSAERRDRTLQRAHASQPLALVVQVTGGADSPWHQASATAAGEVLTALESVVARASGPYQSPGQRPTRWGQADVSLELVRSLRGRAPLAECVGATLQRLLRSFPRRSRGVLVDQLIERLPRLTGKRFDVDLVARQVLATVQQVSAASIEMPAAFQAALAARLGSGAAASLSARTPGSLDWSDAEAFRRAIDEGQLGRLHRSWREGDEGQVQALLALDTRRLRKVAEHGLATHLANAGALQMASGDFTGALKLYDAAIVGDLDPWAAANPLFAVQDDNNHLGIDAARARRYLKRCLPHGKANPNVFLNAGFVWMELGEPQQALEALAHAKAGGVSVKAHRNERLFVPLRGLKAFEALMR